MTKPILEEIRAGLEGGSIIPYLGSGVLDLVTNCPVPNSPEALVERLVAKVSVPHKIRKNLTAAAQFIENFKHRKTLTGIMEEAFTARVAPTELHRYLAGLSREPMLIVDVWYDNAMQGALEAKADWGQIQGVSQSEHFGEWVHYYRPDGLQADDFEAETWGCVLYKPLGSISPERNFLVSDTDFVEVLTEIDIQTPIPEVVKQLRTDRNFLFMGCRFRNQLERTFARQVMKRSSSRHWAVLPQELTRNEERFLEEQNIQRLDITLAEFVDFLVPEKLAA
ncbi:MAG: SIR2 family protein [Burkholderiales bacterium]|nr:SIR2 family protein [Burkholderiales bacterium]